MSSSVESASLPSTFNAENKVQARLSGDNSLSTALYNDAGKPLGTPHQNRSPKPSAAQLVHTYFTHIGDDLNTQGLSGSTKQRVMTTVESNN
jgi:hypothetical protein